MAHKALAAVALCAALACVTPAAAAAQLGGGQWRLPVPMQPNQRAFATEPVRRIIVPLVPLWDPYRYDHGSSEYIAQVITIRPRYYAATSTSRGLEVREPGTEYYVAPRRYRRLPRP